MNTDEALQRLLLDPPRTGIFCDFDGTLSAIVDHPDEARPVPRAYEALEELARAFGVVGVISGRSLADLGSRFSPKGVVLAGSYGREKSDRPSAVATRDWAPVAEAAAAMVRGWDGVLVEKKDSGVALHYRLAPSRAPDVGAVADELIRRFELELRRGRMVAEVTEPGPGKAEALASLIDEHNLARFLFAGDDVADTEAFRWSRGSGHDFVLAGVRSPESPNLIERDADVVFEGPEQLVRFLDSLAARLRRPG